MNPFKKRCTKQITWALAGLLALQSTSTLVRADDKKKKEKPPTAEQIRKNQEQEAAQKNANELAGKGFSMPGVPVEGSKDAASGELQVNQNGTGVYEGYIVTPQARRPIALGFRGTPPTKVYLVLRTIYGREGSFLGILMHPEKDHEHIALYRIDPRTRGSYVMTRLSMENAEGFVASYITVENVNPELKLNIRGGNIMLSAASEQAKWASRNHHDAYFKELLTQEVEFDPAGWLDPTPAVAWTDGPASVNYNDWTGTYRGLFFSKSRKSKAEDRLSIDPMDVTQGGACSEKDPCYETGSNFSFLQQSQDKGDRKFIERFPGIYTVNPDESFVDGDHVEYGEYIGVFLKTGIPKDGVFESKLGTENKLYLVNPSNSDDVMVVKKD